MVVGDGDASALTDAAPGATVLRYDDLLAASDPTGFEYPEVDERAAAAMCYTSGTTGNPKGVVYSHRSTYLHSMATGTGAVVAYNVNDRILPIVPMFHANAWGTPYAAWMAGADLLMPGRFLQAEPLARFVGQEPVTCARGADHLGRPAAVRGRPRRRLLAAAPRHVRGRGCAALAHGAVPGTLRRAHPPGLGHDRDQPARCGGAPTATASSRARPKTSTGAR